MLSQSYSSGEISNDRPWLEVFNSSNFPVSHCLPDSNAEIQEAECYRKRQQLQGHHPSGMSSKDLWIFLWQLLSTMN